MKSGENEMIQISGNTIIGDVKEGIRCRENNVAQKVVSSWSIIELTLLREAAWLMLRATLSAIFTGRQPISFSVQTNKLMINGKRIIGTYLDETAQEPK
jgi:hypothetical protein